MNNLSDNIYKKHTINQLVSILQEAPQSDRLHVYTGENRNDEFPIDYPFRLSHYIVILMHSGKMIMNVDLIKQEIRENDVLIASPGSILQMLQIHPDVEMSILSFTFDYLIENQLNDDFHAFSQLLLRTPPKSTFESSQMEELFSLVTILKVRNKSSNSQLFKNHIVTSLFNSVVYTLASFIEQTNRVSIKLTRNEDIAFQFLTLLKENFRNEHSVRFYADLIHISSDHLSGVLKEVFEKGAQKLINEFLVAESKILLSSQQLTLSEIAFELNFNDQSHFGKFFKSNTGNTPSVFRSGL